MASIAMLAWAVSLWGQWSLIGARSCIAHAGASAAAPPHTLAAYRLALERGADFIEPDLQLTKDGVLVCIHDLSLERTTDVAKVFPDRAREIDQRGRMMKTWLWIDQWQDFLSEDGLDRVAEYAQGVSPLLTFVLGDPTLIERAHRRGLAVHAWQAFESFPPANFPDEGAYIRYLLDEVGLDGLFVHAPELCP